MKGVLIYLLVSCMAMASYARGLPGYSSVHYHVPRFERHFGHPKDLKKCEETIVNVPSCRAEIFWAYWTHQSVSDHCCSFVSDFGNYCLPESSISWVSPWLKQQCSKYLVDSPPPAAAPSPSPPTEESSTQPPPEEPSAPLPGEVPSAPAPGDNPSAPPPVEAPSAPPPGEAPSAPPPGEAPLAPSPGEYPPASSPGEYPSAPPPEKLHQPPSGNDPSAPPPLCSSSSPSVGEDVSAPTPFY